MMIAATAQDFAALIAGQSHPGLAIAAGGIESVEILTMLAGLAATIGADFAPSAWMIVEAGEIAGLCSITAIAADGVIDIGYGVATSRRQRGVARRAIADLVIWATGDARVTAITASTSPENPASQRVLAANGFVQIGTRIDPEDGPLILWRLDTPPGLAVMPAQG